MQIVKKNIIHIFPKAIIFHIIKEVEKFINTELLVQIVNGIGEDNVSNFSIIFGSNANYY